MKNLIVYFSHPGVNVMDEKLVDLEKGNTERIAEFIRDAVGGDLFRIEPVKPYPRDYGEVTTISRLENESDARPEIKAFPETIDGYDVIYLGYPIWWGTMPKPVWTFLNHFDWTGKKIAPFCTNEGSGLMLSERDLNGLCRGAVLCPGLSVIGHEAQDSRDIAAAWAKSCR